MEKRTVAVQAGEFRVWGGWVKAAGTILPPLCGNLDLGVVAAACLHQHPITEPLSCLLLHLIFSNLIRTLGEAKVLSAASRCLQQVCALSSH